jgi:membrane protease YdiL (CAAX protease family)
MKQALIPTEPVSPASIIPIIPTQPSALHKIFSILFGLGHGRNPGESPIGLLSAGLASMVFCFSLWRTGSLGWAIGFHTSWDWGQSFLYGVADSGTMVQHHLLATHPVGKAVFSGGATGPEGSIFIVAVLALASLIIFFTLPRARFGDSPRQGI